MMTKFYDTSSLLAIGEAAFKECFAISSITLKELERIKTASNKDPDIKYAARQLLRLFNDEDCYTICIHTLDIEDPIREANIDITDDTRILSDAISFNSKIPIVFITNDLSLKAIASLFLPNNQISSLTLDDDEYLGYQDITMTETEMADFYSGNSLPKCLINEYINIRNNDNEIVDTRCWDGQEFRPLRYSSFNSHWLGEVKPYKGDIYQAMLADSLLNNKITMAKGPAGSGKTFLSFAYLLSQLEKGKIDKIVVFCNTVATKNSAKLGFYPGTRDEKLLDSQIGNLLSSKLGGKLAVEQLINDEKLLLLPMSDVRGYDTSGMNAGIYISEAQNMDISLLKLALQRIGEDSICIIDGDLKTQVDLVEFSGSNNGMRRASKVFRNHSIYGEVTLKQIHRSEIARLANDM